MDTVLGRCVICGGPVRSSDNPLIDDGARGLLRHRECAPRPHSGEPAEREEPSRAEDRPAS